MDTSKIKIIIVGILSVFVALYLGISVATAQIETVAWMLGSAVLITCIALGRKVWLLIPFMSALAIGLRIPGQPDTGLLGQILVIGFSIPLFLLRRLPYRFAFRELEFWLLVLTLFVAQAYMRNPVGVNVFGGDTVGGKAYVVYAIYLVGGLLLGGLTVPVSELKWLLRLSILGGLMNLVVSIVGNLFPAIGYWTGGAYDQSEGFDNDSAIDAKDATRIGYLGTFSKNSALWISSFVSPLRACFRPLWAVLMLVTLVAAAMSGFRNSIISTGFILFFGICYRSGFFGMMVAVIGMVGGLAGLAVINVIHPLPPNIQRSLTFLPGTWEQRYSADAENSNTWRLEIWKEVLLTNRWIENKWLGDGLGFKASELAAQTTAREGARMGISGFEAHREAILSNGDYHSGPVQTIRTIGYIGLLFLVLAQVRLAVHAHRQIQRCRNTEWFPLALLVGIPLVLAPIIFVLVFGTFKDTSASLFLSYGMIRLLENNLPLPVYVKRTRIPFIPQTVNNDWAPDVKRDAIN